MSNTYLQHWRLVSGVMCAGIITMQSTPAAHAFSTTGSSLYEQIYALTQTNFVNIATENAIEEFAEAETRTEDDTIETEDIQNVLGDKIAEYCDNIACFSTIEIIHLNAKLPTEMRDFGRELQVAATNYEGGISGMTSHPDSLSSKWPSITNIWQSGHDASLSPIPSNPIRQAEPTEEIKNKLAEIKTAISELSEEEQINDIISAAIARYRHGSKEIIASQDCTEFNSDLLSDPASDYLQKLRYCSLEELLSELLQLAENFTFDPPLQPNEIAVFPAYTIKELDTYVWTRQDDVGLNWIYGFETVHPAYSIGTGTLVLAKYAYPPAPEEPAINKGLCSHPFAQRGYLCRTADVSKCPVKEENCAIDPNTNDCYDPETTTMTGAVIGLVTCEQENMALKTSVTNSGPNVCEVGAWLEAPDTAEFAEFSSVYIDTDPDRNDDIQEENNECSSVVIDFMCESECIADSDNLTKNELKTDEGVIRICLNEASSTTEQVRLRYAQLQALSLAQMQANLPPDTDVLGTQEECCAHAYPSNKVACNAMWQDGILQKAGYSVEQCASILSNQTCESFAGSTSSSSSSSSSTSSAGSTVCTAIPADPAELIAKIDEVITNFPDLVAPISCSNLVSAPDTRITSTLYSTAPVCSPNCVAKYRNTIGNNLCYIGQCTEQSIESNRLVPGRWASTTQDESFPWDSCMKPDPLNGNVLPLPSTISTTLPTYNPQQILLQLDAELCLQNGYPRLTPPVLCAYDTTRKIQNATGDVNSTIQGIEVDQLQDAANQSINALAIKIIGSRYGTNIYRQYIDTATPALNEVLATVQSLLKQMADTEFPTVMCPRFAPQDCSYFETP